MKEDWAWKDRPKLVSQAIELLREGRKQNEVANILGISESTVWRFKQEFEQNNVLEVKRQRSKKFNPPKEIGDLPRGV